MNILVFVNYINYSVLVSIHFLPNTFCQQMFFFFFFFFFMDMKKFMAIPLRMHVKDLRKYNTVFYTNICKKKKKKKKKGKQRTLKRCLVKFKMCHSKGCHEVCNQTFSYRFRCGPGIGLTLCCFVVYSTKRFVLYLTLCHFVLVFFSSFSIAITSLGEERADLSALHTFVRFVFVWIYRFRLPLGVWEGLRCVIVALPGLFSYPFSNTCYRKR